jgi:hypothetical protein
MEHTDKLDEEIADLKRRVDKLEALLNPDAPESTGKPKARIPVGPTQRMIDGVVHSEGGNN